MTGERTPERRVLAPGEARVPDRERPATVCPPEILARISDLELVARIVVEGLVSGLHRSPFHGYSAEFSQYRHYRQGDDLKYVDWKLVARTDRVYTKQFRETTNMAAALVVDTSASMAFPPDAERSAKASAERPPVLSKFRYAVVAAAALAHLISTQGDAVGLLAERDDGPVYLAPRTGRQHLRGVLAALSSLRPHAAWKPADAIRRAAERMKRRGLLMVFSDFYDAEEPTLAELRRAARFGHEVVLFQIMSRAEVEFPYRQDFEFADLETGRRLAINAGLARRDYTDAVTAFLERWRTRAAGAGFHYSLVVTDMPPDRVLRNFLIARRG
jgi:uncharacterized protein (DUF58 family)